MVEKNFRRHQGEDEATYLLCDNKSAIAIAKNYVFHSRTRHIAVKYHFIKEAISDGEVQLMYCYICKNNFFVFVLSGCHASTWRDLHRLNLFKQGPLFFWDCLNSSVPGLLQGVTLPFFLSIAFLCFRLKLQPTLICSPSSCLLKSPRYI
ncbi:unnamed protein product, partial [Vitis vinifera]